jgi:hypothetical protein
MHATIAGQEGGAKKRAAKRKSSPAKRKSSPAKKKPVQSIKDRIKAGAKVHVGARGGLFIVFDGKKHPVKC